VVHRGRTVELSDVRRHDTTSEHPTYRYPGPVSVPFLAYSRAVLEFATAVRRFVQTSPPKRFTDPFDRAQYDNFWSEFSSLVGQRGAV
jgi:hypothetical protein